jgi:hypothetical protein
MVLRTQHLLPEESWAALQAFKGSAGSGRERDRSRIALSQLTKNRCRPTSNMPTYGAIRLSET